MNPDFVEWLMEEQCYYFDTSIWVDHYLKRGEHSDAIICLILKIIADGGTIIFSNYIGQELEDIGFSDGEIRGIICLAKPEALRKVQITKAQFGEARKVSKQRGIPLGDAVHAVAARDHQAILVSRDWDFTKVGDIVQSKKPEDLI